ncbi:MAG: hypothetical protein JWM65_1964 [Sphingomonas bacterium]|nr:hypothetical protein [Sphingomonas bacterium]
MTVRREQHRYEAIRIVLFATFAAIAYGVMHDQVTAHLCVEYFTIAHPPVFATRSPFLLALGWGVIATWWVGLPLGIALAVAARAGRAPQLGLADLRRPIVVLMVISAVAAVIAGCIGALLTATGAIYVAEPLATLIPPAKHVAFLADAWAHVASYVVGVLGGLLIIARTVRRRLRRDG